MTGGFSLGGMRCRAICLFLAVIGCGRFTAAVGNVIGKISIQLHCSVCTVDCMSVFPPEGAEADKIVLGSFWRFDGGAASDVPITRFGHPAGVSGLGLTELALSSKDPAGAMSHAGHHASRPR